MVRFKSIEFEKLNGEQREAYLKIASGPRGEVQGPLAIWIQRPELAKRAEALGRYCRFETSLAARLSELAILTTAKIWGSDYEWFAHIKHAQKAGISEKIIRAIDLGVEPDFYKEDEAIVYRVTKELYSEKKISDATFERGQRILGEDAFLDLIGVLGYYALISMTINVFKIPADGF